MLALPVLPETLVEHHSGEDRKNLGGCTVIWDYCTTCGRQAVYREEHEEWKTRCVFCWKQDEGIRLSVSDRYALMLENRVEELRLREYQGLTRRELTDLISLVHPDKHNGSEKATRITQKILDIREGIQ